MTAGLFGGRRGGAGDCLAGIRSGKSMREIAVDLYGADMVEADWHIDS